MKTSSVCLVSLALVGVWLLNAGKAIAENQPQTHPAGHTVNIYRDRYGMAHLYAEREADGFYGLGYAIAEDRLTQVLTAYVAVRGELAATFGANTPPLPSYKASGARSPNDPYMLYDAIGNDISARRYQLLAIARRNFQQLPAQFQSNLLAYIEGMNAFMRQHPERVPSWAPKLEPALPLALYNIVHNEQEGVCDARRKADKAGASAAVGFVEPAVHALEASNAWAVSGSRTADGRVILFSDSHGDVEEYGMRFYPYRIKAGDFDFVSFEPTGTVSFLFGYSPYYGWGITEGPRFVADCYRVKVNPASPREFLYDGKTKKMESVPYTVRVKGGKSVVGTFEYTRHNGVLSPVVARDGDTAYVLSYSYADRIGRAAGAYYRMATSHTRGELEAALAERDVYPANLVIGGADGTVMYIRPARIPIRAPGVDPRHTLDGNSSRTAWRGMHPYKDLVKLIDPPQGYITNNNVSPDVMYPVSPLKPGDFPAYFGFEPGFSNFRQTRLIELLDHASQLTIEDAKIIAMDQRIPGIQAWSSAIARIPVEQPQLLTGEPSDLRSFLDQLAAFDGVFSKESRGATAHFELRRVLYEKHRGEVDALSEAIDSGSSLTLTQQELLVTAAAEARAQMLESYGQLDLTWGALHRIRRGNIDLPIGGARMLVGTDPANGARKVAATLRAMRFSFDPQTKREVMFGGQRIPFLVHFGAQGVKSYTQTLFGVSGDPSSPHYADQAVLASNEQLREIPMTLTALRRDQATQTVLRVPARPRPHVDK